MSSNAGPSSGEGQDAEARDEVITRTFGWEDMFVRPEDDPRTDGGFDSERATLVAYLRDYRLTIELKCSGDRKSVV